MIRSRLTRFAALLALAVPSCMIGSRGGLRPEKDGRTVYLEACASCHGASARGDGPAASAFKNSPADLTELAARHGDVFPRQYVLDVVTGDRTLPAHGAREMPVWNQRFLPTASAATAGASIYTRSHLERIVAYLASIQRGTHP